MSQEANGKTTVEVLTGMLELFGPNGEHWCKHALENSGSYCLLGAAGKAACGNPMGTSEVCERATRSIRECVGTEYPGFLAPFNNAPETTFKEIKEVMCKAIKAELGKAEGMS